MPKKYEKQNIANSKSIFNIYPNTSTNIEYYRGKKN